MGCDHTGDKFRIHLINDQQLKKKKKFKKKKIDLVKVNEK